MCSEMEMWNFDEENQNAKFFMLVPVGQPNCNDSSDSEDQDHEIFLTFYNRNKLLVTNEEYKVAVEAAESALEQFGDMNNEKEFALLARQLGEFQIENKKYSNAIVHLGKSYKLFQTLKMPKDAAMSLALSAKCYGENGSRITALRNIFIALKLVGRKQKDCQVLPQDVQFVIWTTLQVVFKKFDLTSDSSSALLKRIEKFIARNCKPVANNYDIALNVAIEETSDPVRKESLAARKAEFDRLVKHKTILTKLLEFIGIRSSSSPSRRQRKKRSLTDL